LTNKTLYVQTALNRQGEFDENCFASMLFKNGIDVKTVSALLGHSDVSVTYNTYIHLIKEQEQQARKAWLARLRQAR